MSKVLEKTKAKEKIVESIRDLYSAKITLPLGNPNLALVHTNQFLFTELPNDVFELANFDAISKALNSSYSRYNGYVLNRWYVEGITINNDGTKATMELQLNPFASNLLSYRDNKESFQSAYDNANKSSDNTVNSNSSNSVKSVSNNHKLKNVKGFSKKDQAFIKSVVAKALKARNNPTNPLTIAYAIHEYYKKHHVYKKYYDMHKMANHGFKYTWNHSHHNCGDGAATLRAMFKCAGFDKVDIFLGHGHYWVRVKINGEFYYCDQAGSQGAHNTRTLGKKGNDKNVWRGTSDGSIHNTITA